MLEMLLRVALVTFNILLVAAGLGLVVFVHELGHFLAARWAGVRVERFSLGFGKPVLLWKRGETEYCISIVPLGGYVKMTGEQPEEYACKEDENGEPVKDDPRAFQNASVGKRMVIISAGVVMNIVFGFIFFAIVLQMGIQFVSLRDGLRLMPGGPAWKAGVQSGDKVVRFNGIPEPSFMDMKTDVAVTRPAKDYVSLTLQRRGEKEPVSVQMQSIPGGSMPFIGLGMAPSLKYLAIPPEAKEAKGPQWPNLPEAFDKAGRVVSVAGAEVEDGLAYEEQLYRALYRASPRPETVTIGIRPSDKDDAPVQTVELPVLYASTLGLRTGLEPIAAVQDDSPAEKAGIRKGDRILAVTVDGAESFAGFRLGAAFDPYRLAEATAAAAEQGKPVTLKLKRADGKPESITLAPRRVENWGRSPWPAHPTDPLAALDVKALGIALVLDTTLVSVEPDGPAAAAGLKPGDRLTKWALPENLDEPGTILSGNGLHVWASRIPAETELSLTYVPADSPDGKTTKTVKVKLARDADRALVELGIFFDAPRYVRRSRSLTDPFVFGWFKTIISIKRVYLTVRSMVAGTVSPKQMFGPVRISVMAYVVVKRGLSWLLFLLALLSVNLAVVNFLPIPILDGGHMVFLLIEKVKGSPVGLRTQSMANVIGLFLILSLFIFVLYNDITALIGG